MKKITLTIALVFVSIALMSQTKNLKQADKNLKNEKIEKAYELINLAMQEPENANLPQLWTTYARILCAVGAAPAGTLAIEPAIDKPFDQSLEAFKKAIAMDQTGALAVLAQEPMKRLFEASYDKGTVFYGEKSYNDAAHMFEIAFNTATLYGMTDTNAMFNIGLCAELAGNIPLAKKYYTTLVEAKANYPSIYLSLANIHMTDNPKEAARIAELSLQRFPDDYNSMINAASIFLMTEHSEKAKEILADAATRYADKPIVFFALGVAYDQVKMYDECEKAYLRAIELDPTYYDAIFNLGAYYVTRGVNIRTEADKLPLNENKKFDEMISSSNVFFTKAIPHLEKAIEMKPTELGAMQTLRDIYVHVKMLDKAAALKTRIDALAQ